MQDALLVVNPQASEGTPSESPHTYTSHFTSSSSRSQDRFQSQVLFRQRCRDSKRISRSAPRVRVGTEFAVFPRGQLMTKLLPSSKKMNSLDLALPHP